eukprot:CAMPEP_0201234050 /NCGR_PEP_ID=MMETSP0852-20130820/5851_1 /ASSEMBLY_ACC=CAM_ASM_000632 /TAXON_ID=183588 /ORGANISM="Pseudo-nitzschia fraudulenta, Strain WWA7" /LENGTH=244 /DNA_ID=CAMNT_0047527195 /DNA_START=154 /DNA_END=890 /DNA_ORIENTATION=-
MPVGVGVRSGDNSGTGSSSGGGVVVLFLCVFLLRCFVRASAALRYATPSLLDQDQVVAKLGLYWPPDHPDRRLLVVKDDGIEFLGHRALLEFPQVSPPRGGRAIAVGGGGVPEFDGRVTDLGLEVLEPGPGLQPALYQDVRGGGGSAAAAAPEAPEEILEDLDQAEESSVPVDDDDDDGEENPSPAVLQGMVCDRRCNRAERKAVAEGIVITAVAATIAIHNSSGTIVPGQRPNAVEARNAIVR